MDPRRTSSLGVEWTPPFGAAGHRGHIRQQRAVLRSRRGIASTRSSSQGHRFARPQKNLKKCLALVRGIGRNGVILRALRGTMPKFERRSTRALAFRSLLILAGALMMLAAFAPRANAALIVYFNFEDTLLGGVPDFTSEFDQGPGVASTITTDYNPANMVAGAGVPLNVAAGDIDPNNLSLRLTRAASNNFSHFDIPLFTSM